jgi:hypothetical protein
MPFGRADIPDALYIQKNSGEWLPIGFDVLPVSRCGTGLKDVADGEMLYGRDGGFARLEKPGDDTFLQFADGKPMWAAVSTLASHGYARVKTGSYVGNGTSRTISLPVVPKLLVIQMEDDYDQNECVLQQGVRRGESVQIYDAGEYKSYRSGFQLSGNTLKTFIAYGNNLPANAPHSGYNQSGEIYLWTAIY